MKRIKTQWFSEHSIGLNQRLYFCPSGNTSHNFRTFNWGVMVDGSRERLTVGGASYSGQEDIRRQVGANNLGPHTNATSASPSVDSILLPQHSSFSVTWSWWTTCNASCKILDSHRRDYEDYYLLGAVYASEGRRYTFVAMYQSIWRHTPLYLFPYGLFNDAVNRSCLIVLNRRVICG